MNELMDKLVSAIADEVQKKLPVHKEVSADELKVNIEVLLQNADWFKTLVRDGVKDATDYDSMVEEAGEAARNKFESNFSINDYSDEIERIAEGICDNYDFKSIIEEVINDHDFSTVIEEAINNHDLSDQIRDAVDDAMGDVADLPEEVAAIKKRVERHDKFIKAMVAYALSEETTPEEKK
jgi:hypothetical protein